MVPAIDVTTHPDFTVDEFIAATGWQADSLSYKQNLRAALDYFQRVVPRHVLRQRVEGSPWVPKINGVAITLASWLQGINFKYPVNPQCQVNKGDPLIGFKDSGAPHGQVRGNWFTFPGTNQKEVAIHSTQTALHEFKAATTFSCMQTTVSDAYVGWLMDRPAEYRRGGAQQLFIWGAASLLEPA